MQTLMGKTYFTQSMTAALILTVFSGATMLWITFGSKTPVKKVSQVRNGFNCSIGYLCHRDVLFALFIFEIALRLELSFYSYFLFYGNS